MRGSKKDIHEKNISYIWNATGSYQDGAHRLALKEHPDFECHVCVTAQHREMLDQVLDIFDITPDVDLDLMQPSQTLAGLTARAVTGLDEYLKDYQPDLVLVQGDTTTVLSGIRLFR